MPQRGCRRFSMTYYDLVESLYQDQKALATGDFNFWLKSSQKWGYCFMDGFLLFYSHSRLNHSGGYTMSMKIGEKIKVLRKAKNISQESLAKVLGVTFRQSANGKQTQLLLM